MAFAGAKNRKGDSGADGLNGTTPEFTIGLVEQGTRARVWLTGNDQKPILNFEVPQGKPGKKGDKGEKGDPGKTIVVNNYVNPETTGGGGSTVANKAEVIHAILLDSNQTLDFPVASIIFDEDSILFNDDEATL